MNRRFKKVLMCVFLVIVASFVFLFFFNRPDLNSRPLTVDAKSQSSSISEQSDWNAGVYDSSRISINSGDASLNLSTPFTLSGLYQEDNERLYYSEGTGATSPFDGDDLTYWAPTCTGVTHESTWSFDLGAEYTIYTLHILYQTDNNEIWFYHSTDGVSWTDIDYLSHDGFLGDSGHGTLDFGSGVNARYFKSVISTKDFCTMNGCVGELHDFSFTGLLSATHLSAPTQITNTNLYQWQTFTPTYTQPANTTVSFRLRTSTDANTWTSWTAYQTPNSGSSLDITSLVTSKTGDAGSETFYKYIQVETKLTSANGTSNPTVDDYSIGYHTNVVPNKPVGATVTMGS